MSTRGVVGFRYRNTDKLAYNHSDSYPSYLGDKVVRDLHALLCKGRRTLLQQVEGLTVVQYDSPRPEAKERRRLEKYSANVGSLDEYWYRALRETQGDIRAILDSKYILDSGVFILDSLFCEWGYIVNLDNETLEVYRGYQKEPHTNGRYSHIAPMETGYYPCALIHEFTWSEIRDNLEATCEQMVALEDEAT